MSDKKRKLNSKLRLVILVVAAALVAGGAGLGLRWWLIKDQPAQLGEPLPKVIDDIQNARFSGDSASAEQQIKDSLADPNLDSEMRREVYIQQGHNHLDNKEYDKAIESYKLADQLKQTHTTAWLLGDVYKTMGNNEQAVVYYEQAIPLIPNEDPLAEADREYLRHLINMLGTQ